jgi:hypothetical protein
VSEVAAAVLSHFERLFLSVPVSIIPGPTGGLQAVMAGSTGSVLAKVGGKNQIEWWG